MLTFTAEEFRDRLEREAGSRPSWSAEAFSDIEDDVRLSMTRILDSPYVPEKRAASAASCSTSPPAG